MSTLSRFGISLEKKLLDEFDRLIKKRHYTNRSEAFRDLIRQELVKEEWLKGNNVAGAITLVYDHHKRELGSKLTDIQHDFQETIISMQHTHVDHDNCLEIIAVRGKPANIVKLANTLKSLRGVKHAMLSMSTTGKSLK